MIFFLISLTNNKLILIKALNDRLKDLSQNFEEATVDKKEQEEKVHKMKSELQTASELNSVLKQKRF